MDQTPVDHTVFVSYAHANREETLRIVELLERNHITIWLDRASDGLGGVDVGDDFGHRIVEAIEKASVFLLVMSPESMASKHVRQEIKLAFDKDVAILPVRVTPTELPADVEYILKGRLYIDISDPKFDELVLNGVRKRVNRSRFVPRYRNARRALIAVAVVLAIVMAVGGWWLRRQQRCDEALSYYRAFVPELQATNQAARGLLRNWQSLKDDTSLLNQAAHEDIAKKQLLYLERYSELRKDWTEHQVNPEHPNDEQLSFRLEAAVGALESLHVDHLQRFDKVGSKINQLEKMLEAGPAPDVEQQKADIRTDIGALVSDATLAADRAADATIALTNGRPGGCP